MNKLCRKCNSRMVNVISFSESTIRKYDRCEKCNNEDNNIEIERNGIKITEFFDNEKKKCTV